MRPDRWGAGRPATARSPEERGRRAASWRRRRSRARDDEVNQAGQASDRIILAERLREPGSQADRESPAGLKHPLCRAPGDAIEPGLERARLRARSEEHTSELQSPYVISYAVFC